MPSRSKAMRAAIGLAVLAAHLALLLYFRSPSRNRERETVAETAVALYWVAPIHEPRRPLTRSGANGRSSTAPEGSSASERRAPPARTSRRRTPRAAVLARHSTSRVPPVHAVERQGHPAAPIDWNLEAEDAAKQEIAREGGARQRASGLTHRSGVSAAISEALRPPPPPPPKFGWGSDRRVEVINGVGILVRLSKHCTLLIAGLMLLPGCTLGKLPPARGDLFAHMHDPTDPDGTALP